MKALSLLKALLGPGPGRSASFTSCQHDWRQQGAKKHCKRCGYYIQANGALTSVSSYQRAQRRGEVRVTAAQKRAALRGISNG